MEGKITLLPTLDGSFTFYNQNIHQSYHSANGALQEAQHVFLENGLQNYLKEFQTKEASILEVGFGSGLNFLVTADYCEENNIALYYTGLEPYPLDRYHLIESHYNKWINHQKIWNELMRVYPGIFQEEEAALTPLIRLKLVSQKLEQFKTEPRFDLIYFDAFAPITQPEIWSKESISHVLSLLKPEGRFITYSITGNLKRIFRALNFQIERPKGAAGKREMLRAFKKEADL